MAVASGKRTSTRLPFGEDENGIRQLAERLRGAGFAVDLGYSGNVGKRMKRANKVGAVAAIMLGETEIVAGKATVRDMQTGEQAEVPLTSLEDHLARFR